MIPHTFYKHCRENESAGVVAMQWKMIKKVCICETTERECVCVCV